MQLSQVQRNLLSAMAGGSTLKAHRGLDGEKQHLLHPLHGEPQPVSAGLVESLRDRGLIQSNLKFPAATYVLTDLALQQVSGREAPGGTPLTLR